MNNSTANLQFQTEIDTSAFEDRMAGMLNDAAVSVMISLGHRLGLFDALAARPGATAAQLAESAGLDARYVREWLSVMTTGCIVEYTPASDSFRLPPQAAACLTRAAAPGNIAVSMRYISVIAQTEDRLVECFRSGRGLPYDAYPCFHEVMAEDSHQTVVCALFDGILPLVPGLVERLESGIDVLDAGCGRGLALLELARRFPASRFTGYDLCADAFEPTAAEATAAGVKNIRFAARDMSGFDEPGRYDLVTTFDAVHDQADPQGLLDGIARALRSDGIYLMQDIAGSSHLQNNLDHPLGPLLYAISCAHCTPVSIGQGGPGLGTLWGEELAEDMLRRAGFDDIEVTRLEHDPFNVYFVARRASPPQA